MRVPALFLTLLFGAVAVGACTGSPGPSASPGPTAKPTAPVDPSPTGVPQSKDDDDATVTDAQAQAIFDTYRQSFEKVTTANITSPAHGEVEIWVDRAHASQYKTVGAEAPDGMTVVKNVVDSQKVYLMKKVKGFDPANNDWYYANVTESGALGSTGKPQLCIGCHAQYKPTDYMGAPAEEYAKSKLK